MSAEDDAQRWQYVAANPHRAIDILRAACGTISACWTEEACKAIDEARQAGRETVQIEVARYRDSHGEPTCARDFTVGEVCAFYGTEKFGCAEVCRFPQAYAPPIQRRGISGTGSLIPTEHCPLWTTEREVKV